MTIKLQSSKCNWNLKPEIHLHLNFKMWLKFPTLDYTRVHILDHPLPFHKLLCTDSTKYIVDLHNRTAAVQILFTARILNQVLLLQDHRRFLILPRWTSDNGNFSIFFSNTEARNPIRSELSMTDLTPHSANNISFFV